MLAYCRRALVLALCLGLVIPAIPTHAAPADILDGMNIDLSAFSPAQQATIRNGIALFADMASPTLRLPANLPVSPVPGAVSTTIATWQTQVLVDLQSPGISGTITAPIQIPPRLVGVAITFGTDGLTAAQVVHELIHVAQVENPAWGERERAFAALHPYPQAGMGAWLDTPTAAPMSELCPRVIEALMDGGAMAAYAGRQPEDVRYCLTALQAG